MLRQSGMSFRGAIVGSVRGVLIAIATGGAALGLLAVFHPFAPPPLTATLAIPPGSSAADVLQQKIGAARDTLRQTQQALDNVKGGSLAVSSGAPAAGEFDAQIAAAIERRDLAGRHAQAIRDALKSGTDLGSLAGIRDSVVIGQLLSRQTALDAQIAEQGARFKPNHPVMRALAAQKAALVDQVKAEAASIASALESEAKLDDAQIRLLQSQSSGAPASVAGDTNNAAALGARRDAAQTRLDQLLDAYFSLRPGSAATLGASSAGPDNLLSPLNLFVVAVAALVAMIGQIGFALRRRRLHREALDLALWTHDRDPEHAPEPAVAAHPRQSVLRKAS